MEGASWDLLLDRFARSFTVERLTGDRLDALCEFFDRAYADQPVADVLRSGHLMKARLRWLNEENPVRLAGGGLPAWVCLRGDRIVGHFAVLPAVAVLRGKDTPICWTRDLIVAPEVRQAGVGPLLVMHACRDVQQPVLGAGLNDVSYPLLRRMGFADGGVIPLHVRVCQPSRLLETLAWRWPMRRLAGAAMHATAWLTERLGRGRHLLPVSSIEHFDERFDRWWARQEPKFPCVVRRTSATMTWRYRRHPTHAYRVGAVWDGDALRGAVITRHGRSRGLPTGFIAELLADPRDKVAIDSLIWSAVDSLTRSPEPQPVLLRCSMLHRSLEGRLIRAGFFPVRSPNHWVMRFPEGNTRAGVPHGRRQWLLNGGDADLDML